MSARLVSVLLRVSCSVWAISCSVCDQLPGELADRAAQVGIGTEQVELVRLGLETAREEEVHAFQFLLEEAQLGAGGGDLRPQRAGLRLRLGDLVVLDADGGVEGVPADLELVGFALDGGGDGRVGGGGLQVGGDGKLTLVHGFGGEPGGACDGGPV